MRKVVLSFKIEEWIKSSLQKIADDEHRSMSNLIRVILLEYLKKKGIEPPKK